MSTGEQSLGHKLSCIDARLMNVHSCLQQVLENPGITELGSDTALLWVLFEEIESVRALAEQLIEQAAAAEQTADA